MKAHSGRNSALAADGVLRPPRQLVKGDDRAFQCGIASLDLWFHRYALQNQRAKNCAVYVSTWNERVAGYYAICTGGLEKEAAPGTFAKGRPDPIPVITLARLAVDVKAQGKGVGRALLRDALLLPRRLGRQLSWSTRWINRRRISISATPISTKCRGSRCICCCQ